MNEVATQSYSTSDYANAVTQNLSRSGSWERAAGAAGNKLSSLEDQLMSEMSNPNPDQGKIEKLQIAYKRAQRIYEMIRELINSMHETLMRGIQSLRTS